QAVSQNGKSGEGQPVGPDLRRGRYRRLDARHSRVHQFQGAEHVHFPIEEQVDFGRTAAGDGPNAVQPLHGVEGFLDGPRYRDQHLVDGHDAVIHADDHARKIGGRKDRHRDGERQVGPDRYQRENHEDDGLAVAGRPVRLLGRDGWWRRRKLAHFSFESFSSFSPGLTMRILALSSRPTPPATITCSPGATPLRICTRSGSRTPISTFFRCASESEPATATTVPPSSPGRMAESGTTVTF